MKKSNIFFLLILLFFSIKITNVNAGDQVYNDAEAKVNRNAAILMCEYSGGGSGKKIRVYYEFAEKSSSCTANNCGIWKVFINKNNYYAAIGYSTNATFNTTFNGGDIYYNQVKNYYTSESNFTCAPYATFETDGNKEVCFSDNRDRCEADGGNKFDGVNQSLMSNGNTFREELVSTAGSLLSNITLDELKNNDIESLIKQKTKEKLKSKYYFDSKYYFPPFFDNHLNNISKYYNDNFVSKYSSFVESMNNKIDNSSLTEDEKNTLKNKISNYQSSIQDASTNNTTDIESDRDYIFESNRDDEFSHNCRDFSPTLRIAGYVMILIKIAIPLILIVKSSISLASVAMKGSPDEMKKYTGKVVKSLVAGVIIFFIPTIVDIIFGFVDKYNTGITEDSKICTECIFHPSDTVCTNAVNYEDE